MAICILSRILTLPSIQTLLNAFWKGLSRVIETKIRKDNRVLSDSFFLVIRLGLVAQALLSQAKREAVERLPKPLTLYLKQR